MNNNDELRRRITRSDTLYMIGICIAMLIVAAMGYALVTFTFLTE